MRKLIIFFIFAFPFLLNAQSYEPKWVGEVLILNCSTDTISIPTEKANVRIKTSSGFINGYTNLSIKGGRSTTQISPLDPIILVIKCRDNQSDPSSFIQVIKFEEKKKERKAELARENAFGGMSEGNMTIIPYEADRYGKNSYILKINPMEGEFGVYVLNPNDKDEKNTLFYCFGSHTK